MSRPGSGLPSGLPRGFVRALAAVVAATGATTVAAAGGVVGAAGADAPPAPTVHVRPDDGLPCGGLVPVGGPEPGRPAAADDLELALRVQARFASEVQLRALQLRAEAERGIVQISGVAPGAVERRVAELVAREVPGVRAVINRIAVFGAGFG